MEQKFERLLYAGRWLLAPVYLGLSFVLLLLCIKFFLELFHMFPLLLSMKEGELVLRALTLIDISLVGGLIIMVMFSGYENFISRIDVAEEDEKLAWLGKMDAGSLKQKVAASIVAISAIHLLKAFMEIDTTSNDKLQWYVIIHLTFVVSAIGMGVIDNMYKKPAGVLDDEPEEKK